MKEIIIDEVNSNQRLDKFLKRILSEATNSFIYKMLRKKNITLNGKKADGSEKLSIGDSVKIFFSDDTFEKMSGSGKTDPLYEQLRKIPFNIDIIHEDEEKIIINKPVGILSQKANSDDISINEMALSYLINNGQLEESSFKSFHPSVVNRLDRNTTGLIIFAKTLKASQILSESLKQRSAKKIYHAVVKGKISDTTEISGYLLKDEATNKVEIYNKKMPESKSIKTAYEPLKYSPEFDVTLISVHLITGRTHQIRAHLASIGHPIVGDYKYGDDRINKKLNAKSQLLHAYSIEFEDGTKYIAKEPKEFNVYI